MGIYYAAYDYKKKEIIHPQGDEAIKWPGILACGNKFAAVVVLANMELENNFKIISEEEECIWKNAPFIIDNS